MSLPLGSHGLKREFHREAEPFVATRRQLDFSQGDRRLRRMTDLALSGQRLARGVCRHLLHRGFAPMTEVPLATGLRVDVMAIGPKGEIWIVECKSGRADFMTDRKWTGYLEWCERFFWAVDADFPVDLLPAETGLIIADAFGAEIERTPEAWRLAGARRRAVTLRFARLAAARLATTLDPSAGNAMMF